MIVETSIANHTEADFYDNKTSDSIALGPKQPLESPKAVMGLKVISAIGFLVHVLDLSAGIAVFTSAQFKSQDTYTLYFIFLLANPVLLILISLYTCVVALPKMKSASQVHVANDVSSGREIGRRIGILKVLTQPVIIYTGAFRLIDKTSLLLVTPKSCLLIEVLGQSLPHLIIIIFNLVT